MKSLKNLFLFSLLVSLLAAEVYAGPTRIFGREPKPSLTTEEQTDLNRAAAQRAGSDEDETGEGEENPSKIARGETMPDISEAPSQAAPEGQGEVAVSSSSSAMTTAPVRVVTAPVRFLRTNVIPVLKRFALEKLMTLPATHAVFNDGLPPLITHELVAPYFDNINAMIQDVHQACQKYALYRLSPDVKEKNSLIKVKKALQGRREACQNKLLKATERDYPNALFRMDSMIQVFPELKSGIEHLKEQEDYNKQAKLARNSGQIGRAALLENVVAPLHQQANLLLNIAGGKIKLQQKLLEDKPDAEIAVSHENIANQERRLAQITPIIERQKIFLGRVEEFSPAQQQEMHHSFQSSLNILNALGPASAQGDEERVQLLQRQLNAHDQTIKALLSTDPRVQRLQEKIGYGNEKVVSTTSMMVDIKAEQRRIASTRENRIMTTKEGEEKVMSEGYAPIFDLYQIPSSFLDKEITLLQEAEVDSLAGRETLAFQKRRLAAHWQDLATGTAKSVNVLSQLGMIVSPGEFLGQNETAIRAALIDREGQLAAQAAMLPVDRNMASLPWDFSKTFEENVAALPQEEEL